MLQVNDTVIFANDSLPYKVKLGNKDFAICTRKISKRNDSDLIWNRVNNGAYFTFTEAYNALKETIVYTIADFRNNARGSHNLVFNDTDFNDDKDLLELMSKLISGEIELSNRNKIALNISKVISVCSSCKSNDDVVYVEITDCNLCDKCRNDLSDSFEEAQKIDRSDYLEL